MDINGSAGLKNIFRYSTPNPHSDKAKAPLNNTSEKIQNTPFKVSISKKAIMSTYNIPEKIQSVDTVSKETNFILTESQKANLFQAFLNQEGETSYTLMNTLMNLSDEDRETFLTISGSAEESMDAFLELTNALSETDRSLFLKIGAKMDTGLDHLIHMTKNLTGESRTEFLKFVDTLKENAIPSFLDAAIQSGDQFDNLLNMAGKLSGDQQEFFFKAAARSGPNMENLIQTVENILSEDEKTGAPYLSNFLQVMAHSEGDVSDILKIHAASIDPELRSDLFSFGAGLDESDISLYISGILKNNDSENHLSSFLTLTKNLTGNARKSYLQLSSVAGDTIDDVNRQVNDLLRYGQSEKESLLNQYLEVAVKSGEQIDTLVSVVHNLDKDMLTSVLSKASDLNMIDAQNFLAGISSAPKKHIENFIQSTQTLSDKEQSWFLYAAAQIPKDETENDLEELITKTNELKGEERNEYLLLSANAKKDDEAPPDPWIHLRKEFSHLEIKYIDWIAKDATDTDFDELMLQTDNLKADERKLYLRTAAYAGDKRTDLIELFGGLSHSGRTAFLSLSGKLSRHDLPDYISASINAKDDIEGFADQVNKLHDREPIHLIRAVSHAGKRTKDLLTLVDKLSGANRQAFLLSAAYADSHVGLLIDMANNFINTERDHFFSIANEKGNDLRGLFYQTQSPLYKHNSAEITGKINSTRLVGTQAPNIFSDIFMSAFKARDNIEAFAKAYL